ncbi:hypothetical protein [Endozoicomonas sp. 2B-B]
MFSVLQIWLYRFPIILSAFCINAGYCCTHHRAEVQTRCEKVLKAFPGVFTNVVFHDVPGESLGSIQESQNTLHIVTSDYALNAPITVPDNAINVGIVGVATDGKYPTLSLKGTRFSTGVDEFIRVSGTRLLYVDGFELDAGGSFANVYGNLNHFIHARSDRVTLKNLKLHKANEYVDSAIYVERSKKLEGSHLEIWRDGYKKPPLIETKGVFEVQFSDSTVHGFPSECTLILHENSHKVSYSNFTYPVKHSQSWQSGVTPGIFIVYKDPEIHAAKLSFENISTKPSASHDSAFDKVQVPLWVNGHDKVLASVNYKNNTFDRANTPMFLTDVHWEGDAAAIPILKTPQYQAFLTKDFVPKCLRERYTPESIERNTESLDLSNTASHTNELDDTRTTLIVLGFYTLFFLPQVILISLLHFLPDRHVRHYHLERKRG